HWVFGIELDSNYLGMNKDFSSGVFVVPTSGDSYTFRSKFNSNWLLTARPRFGYSIDRFFIYATAAFSIAHHKLATNITQLNVAFGESGSASQTSVGWALGGGVEYAIDNHWSAKAEYLYVDPGSISYASYGHPGTGYLASHSAHLKTNIIRLGINYRF